MESNKNPLANVLLVVVTLTAVILVGFLIFGNAGINVSDTKQVSAGGRESNLNDEGQRVFEKERQAFFDETQDLRQNIYKKRLELQDELAKNTPDAQKAADLHKDISKLAEEFNQKRLAFILKMKKIDPNFWRMGLRGTEQEDDDVKCPNDGRRYGHHMGRRHGYGMGPELNRLQTPLQEDGARAVVENYLQSTRNPNLKLGKITEHGDVFEAEIVTKDGSLVDKLIVDKSTGWMNPSD